ncbi:sugar ABC transporter permease [Paenibacillus sp. IB182496]|uniref:Sugar ABC transporter permease n=1 Tax=Paenibacillus sabuli TaxID=2772509 RepID=A0A927BWW9_9BACL|nr:sugar ABC transporter permease [Paenibacillus sabuli]MBD2848381.1 sugar ABC transporter permease [Paenibacillus sabuli]
MAWFRKRPFLWFIAPGLLLYSVFTVYPIFSAIQISLNHWDGIGPMEFVGLANYVELFTSETLLGQFKNALGNSLTIFLLNALAVLPAQLYMAYLIYTEVRGYRFVQAMIFSPQFISTPVIVFMGTLLLDGNIGVFNKLLEAIGLGEYARPWMGLPELGIYIVWLLAAWAGIGVGMIFFLGAMKMISGEVMEAALLDGATFWRRFFSIVLPQLKTTILNMLVLTYIFSMTVFDYSFILGGVSGGIGGSMDVMALFFYRMAFGDNSAVGGTLNTNAMGMGTTIACVMFAIIFVVALIQVAISYRSMEED